jgi:hypothetical protein
MEIAENDDQESMDGSFTSSLEKGESNSNEVSDPADGFETDEEERLGLEIFKSKKKTRIL